MSDWLKALADFEAKGEACVLVTVLDVQGSTPRAPGTKMVVAASATFATIGGGHLEFRATEIARELLAGGNRTAATPAPLTERFALGPSLGQCCGGSATLLFEAFRPMDFTIHLFGAGHVGRALVAVLSPLPCRITWIDSREDYFPPGLPDNVVSEFSEAPEDEVVDAPPGSYFLVMTHSHAVDLRICQAVLERGDFRYLGLIGSRTKRQKFERRFRDRGLAPETIARMTCPIGVPGIAGKRPAEIAIAVAAELLALRSAEEAARADAGDDERREGTER